MHTDQYLEWDSHHNLTAKYSVLSTIGQKLFVLDQSFLLRNYNTLGGPWPSASSISGP